MTADNTRIETPSVAVAPPTRVEATAPPTRLDGTPAPGPSPVAEGRGLTVLPARLASHFTPLEIVGAGGEATVYKCRDDDGYIEKESIFAIKVYRTAPAFIVPFGTDEFRRRFAHDTTVQVLERGGDDGNFYDIMEFCEFGTLADHLDSLLRRRVEDNPAAEAILRAIATAVARVQRPDGLAPMVHGDVKPQNIMVRNRNPLQLVLGDFGLSVELTDRSKVTNTGRGSYLYLAPGAREHFTLASDWWSVGMILFRVLVGRDYFSDADGRAFDENTVASELATHDISLESIESLSHFDASRRARWLLLLTGLLTRAPEKRWGYDEVIQWLRGRSPSVATAALQVQRRDRALAPLSLPGTPELWSLGDVTQWFTESSPSSVLGSVTGQSPAKLMNWIKSEFPAAQLTFSLWDTSWGPNERAAYLTSALAPEAPLSYMGFPVSDVPDLLALAANADASDAVEYLFVRDVVSALYSPGRTTFPTINSRWHAIVDAVDDLARRQSVTVEPGQRTAILRNALAAAAGDDAQVAAQLEARVAANSDAHEQSWFRSLLT